MIYVLTWRIVNLSWVHKQFTTPAHISFYIHLQTIGTINETKEGTCKHE